MTFMRFQLGIKTSYIPRQFPKYILTSLCCYPITNLDTFVIRNIITSSRKSYYDGIFIFMNINCTLHLNILYLSDMYLFKNQKTLLCKNFNPLRSLVNYINVASLNIPHFKYCVCYILYLMNDHLKFIMVAREMLE